MSEVLILGATGLVGGECLKLCLREPAVSRVVVLARRALPATLGSSKLERHVVDLERLEAVADRFAVDAVICALGTTIKQAGSKERFRAVDYDIPLAGQLVPRPKRDVAIHPDKLSLLAPMKRIWIANSSARYRR